MPWCKSLAPFAVYGGLGWDASHPDSPMVMRFPSQRRARSPALRYAASRLLWVRVGAGGQDKLLIPSRRASAVSRDGSPTPLPLASGVWYTTYNDRDRDPKWPIQPSSPIP